MRAASEAGYEAGAAIVQPRQSPSMIALHQGPSGFGKSLEHALGKSLAHAKRFHKKETMLLVPAFNEWSEQSTLEPSDRYGVGYLQALRSAMVRHGQYRYRGQAGLWKQMKPEGGGVSHEMTNCDVPSKAASKVIRMASAKEDKNGPAAGYATEAGVVGAASEAGYVATASSVRTASEAGYATEAMMVSAASEGGYLAKANRVRAAEVR